MWKKLARHYRPIRRHIASYVSTACILREDAAAIKELREARLTAIMLAVPICALSGAVRDKPGNSMEDH